MNIITSTLLYMLTFGVLYKYCVSATKHQPAMPTEYIAVTYCYG